MSRRIDIELTSRKEDGSWTWRAPGARQPRGTLDGALLPTASKVGDVLRAEADFELEGITVTAVQAPRAEHHNGSALQRIEILGSGRDKVEGVSVTLAPGSRRPRDEGDHDRRPRRGPVDRVAARPSRSRPAAGGDDETGPPIERGRPRAGRPQPGARPRSGRDGQGTPRDDAAVRSAERRSPAARTAGAEGRARSDRPARRDRPRRAEPVTTNRNAALAALSPEQIPVAEQLLRGGIPAVRQAIDEQNARARAEGRAEVSRDPLLSMAEELLPRMNLAAWKDRAVALRTAGRDAPLRELRSVVAGASTVTLDDEGRTLLTSLRETLDARVTQLRDAWLGRITAALDAARVTDALRAAAQPPEPTARIPADLAVRLSETAGTTMAPSVGEEAWIELLDAVVKSPVRRTVKPAGLPPDATPELLTAARHAAGHVPELARLLGLPIPPPPGPRRARVAATRGG